MKVEPKFHEGASNLEELVPFEECIELHSSEKAVVRAPEFLLLTHNGRSFKLVSSTSIRAFFFLFFLVHFTYMFKLYSSLVFRVFFTFIFMISSSITLTSLLLYCGYASSYM